MARPKTIKIAALNITTHPHSPDRYVELLAGAFDERHPYRFRSDYHAMIGSMHIEERNGLVESVHGEIYKFLDFDINEPWLNLQEQKAADEGDRRQIQIPEHLKPGFMSARYVFLPNIHRLFFERSNENQKGFAQATMQKIMYGLLNTQPLRKKYGEVDVVIEPSTDALEKIFSIPRLRTLDIVLTRPNPDDQDAAERKFLRKLNQQNARRLETKLTAAGGESLAPDEDTKLLARVAASNGSVTGDGKDAEGNPLHESTLVHPWEDSARYNPVVQGPREAFLDRVSSLARRFTNRFRE